MEFWTSDPSYRGLIIYQPNDTQYSDCIPTSIAYRALCKTKLVIIVLVILLLELSGCAEQPTPYKPPTVSVRATLQKPTSPAATTSPKLTDTAVAAATPTCRDNLTFLKNQTLPYGAMVKPGENLDKRWLVENSGTCDWGEGYYLKLVSGMAFGVPEVQALYPARSGTRATLRMLLIAPAEPGVYQSAWQAYNPQGQAFGEPVFAQIVVEPTNP